MMSDLLENRITSVKAGEWLTLRHFTYSDENRAFYGFRPMNERVFPQPGRGKWVLLATFLLPFVGLYGLNWLIYHPEFVTVFRPNPLFEKPEPADVIVALAGRGERARYAALLIERRLAPRMLSTLVDTACLSGRGLGELCATGVRNTVDEALTMRRVLARERVDRVIIVTSRDHVVRTAAIFSLIFFGTGIDVNVVATPLGAYPKGPAVRELLSFFPSLGGAVLGRFAPELYELIMQSRPWLSIIAAPSTTGSV